ncbi:unnamed protein product [Cochlearia groenlandica]
MCGLQILREQSSETVVTMAPKEKRMERLNTLEKEHKDALERAVSLNIPHAVSAAEEEEIEIKVEEECENVEETSEPKPKNKKNWDQVVEKLFHRSNSGEFVLKENVVSKT